MFVNKLKVQCVCPFSLHFNKDLPKHILPSSCISKLSSLIFLIKISNILIFCLQLGNFCEMIPRLYKK